MNPPDPTLLATRTSTQTTALAPLRTELLRRAHADADRIRRDAEATVAKTLAAAEAQRDQILAAAAIRGKADAAEIQSAWRARVRHSLRAEELAAHRAVYEELAARVTEAVCELRHDPGYQRLRQRLAGRARELLGPDAVVTEAPGGGIVAHGPGRRLDYSLAGFAARAVERLGADVAGLWQP